MSLKWVFTDRSIRLCDDDSEWRLSGAPGQHEYTVAKLAWLRDLGMPMNLFEDCRATADVDQVLERLGIPQRVSKPGKCWEADDIKAWVANSKEPARAD